MVFDNFIEACLIGEQESLCSRVFRVLNHANELYAIKRVSLDKLDADTMSCYMNGISLLKRLEELLKGNGSSRIIGLIDSEVKAGPGGNKCHLLLVMECGEIDLARLLQEQMWEFVNMVLGGLLLAAGDFYFSFTHFRRPLTFFYQMLQAVHVIHEE